MNTAATRTAKTRAEVGGGGGGEEAGELGPVPSAALCCCVLGGQTPPPSSRGDFRCAGGVPSNVRPLLSQMQQHHLDSEAHDGDGGGVGETAARVATVTMNVA